MIKHTKNNNLNIFRLCNRQASKSNPVINLDYEATSNVAAKDRGAAEILRACAPPAPQIVNLIYDIARNYGLRASAIDHFGFLR